MRINITLSTSQRQETLTIVSPWSDVNYVKLNRSEVRKKLFDFFDVISESDDWVVLWEIVDTYWLSTWDAIYVHHGKYAIVFAYKEDLWSDSYMTIRISRKIDPSSSSDIAQDLPYLCKLTSRIDFTHDYEWEFEIIKSPYIPKVLGVKPTMSRRHNLLQQLYLIFSSPSIERVKSQIPYSIELGKELATSLEGVVGESGLFVNHILKWIQWLANIPMYGPDNLFFDFFIPWGHGDITGDNTLMRYLPWIDDLLSSSTRIYLIDLPDNPREKNLLFDLFALSSVGFSFATNQYIVLNTRQSLPPLYSSDFQWIRYLRFIKNFHGFTKEVAMYVYHIYLKSPISREDTKPRNEFYQHWLDWVEYNIFHIVGYCFDQLRSAYESENRKLIVYYTNALSWFYIDYRIINKLKKDSIPDFPNRTMIVHKEELLNINMIVYNEELLKQYTGLTIDQFNSLLEYLPFPCVIFCSLTENLSPFELMFARIVFAILIYNIVQEKINNRLSRVDKITNFFQSNYNLNLSWRIFSIIPKIPIKEWESITNFYRTLLNNEK